MSKAMDKKTLAMIQAHSIDRYPVHPITLASIELLWALNSWPTSSLMNSSILDRRKTLRNSFLWSQRPINQWNLKGLIQKSLFMALMIWNLELMWWHSIFNMEKKDVYLIVLQDFYILTFLEYRSDLDVSALDPLASTCWKWVKKPSQGFKKKYQSESLSINQGIFGLIWLFTLKIMRWNILSRQRSWLPSIGGI